MSSRARTEIQKIVLKVFDALDRTGSNSEKHRKMFGSMDDKAFDKWVKALLKDDDAYIQLEVMPFKNEPTINDIEKAAKVLGVPLEENVYFPHEGGTSDDGGKEPVRTARKVPVGYIHVCRLQQILAKKNSYTTNVDRRNQLTGQVVADSKIARNSEHETAALITMEADGIVRELMGPRSDNRGKKLAMYNAIGRDGFVNQDEIEEHGTVLDNASLVMADVFLTGAGLKTDLLAEGDRLVLTLIESG